MKSTTVLSSGFALIGATNAAVLNTRQASFKFECNGQEFPDTGDCDQLFKGFTDGTKTYTPPDGGNMFSISLGDHSNCQVDLTWNDLTYVITENQIDQGVHGVGSTCFVSGTGGYANDVGKRFSIGVRNNPNYEPPSNKKIKAKRVQRGLIPQGKMEEKRADGDTSFTYGVHTVYAKPESMKHNIGEGLPGGSTWQWSKSQSVTDHVGFSSSISGGIDKVLSLSLSTEISEDKTWTSGQTTTITISCESNQYGQVYFQGYAEVWQGSLEPSGDALTVTKPMANSDGSTAGFYSYDCIAK